MKLSLVMPTKQQSEASWFSDTPHDDVRGWRGPIGFGLINLSQPAVCCCCGKAIEPVDTKIEDREERSALRRKSLVARWILPGGETGAASRYAHPKCLAALRGGFIARGLFKVDYSEPPKQPEGLSLSAEDLVDSHEKKAQEARIKNRVDHGYSKEAVWRQDVQEVQERESRKVKELLAKQPGRPLKPERGDEVVAFGSHWRIQSLDGSTALLSSDSGSHHLRLPIPGLIFVSRPGLLVVDPSFAKYHHSN